VRSTGGKNQLFVVARTRPASVALVETTPHEYYTAIIQYIIVVVELLLLLGSSSSSSIVWRDITHRIVIISYIRTDRGRESEREGVRERERERDKTITLRCRG